MFLGTKVSGFMEFVKYHLDEIQAMSKEKMGRQIRRGMMEEDLTKQGLWVLRCQNG